MNKLNLTFVITAIALAPMMAAAQFGDEPGGAPGNQDRDVKTFQQLDKDQDGALNESEAKEADIVNFDEADKNDDDKIDAREYYSAVRGDDPQGQGNRAQ